VPGGSFTNSSTSPNSELVMPAGNFGEVEATWTESNTTKCVDSDKVLITFFEQPDTAYAGEDILLQYEFNTSLNALEPIIGSGSWQLFPQTGVFSDATLYNSELVLNEVGEYQVIWTVANGVCNLVEDDLQLIVEDVILYEGFSPNGDGINEKYIIDLAEGSSATLTIMDKNGSEVAEISAEIEITWDGKNKKGIDLPAGIYFYIFEDSGVAGSNETRKPSTGYIEIRR
jgi:gliding motility-associated-like protein